MLKAIIRFLMVWISTLIDGLTIIFFDKEEIVEMLYCTKPIIKPPSEEQRILVKYLKQCHKQVFKGKNIEKRNKKEIDTETD